MALPEDNVVSGLSHLAVGNLQTALVKLGLPIDTLPDRGGMEDEASHIARSKVAALAAGARRFGEVPNALHRAAGENEELSDSIDDAEYYTRTGNVSRKTRPGGWTPTLSEVFSGIGEKGA